LFLSVSHVGFLKQDPALAFAGLGACLGLVLALGIAGERLPGGMWLAAALMAAFGGAYGYGAAVFTDTHFDHDRGQIFRGRIEGESMSGGRSSRPHVVLAPWGPVAARTNIQVTYDVYRSTRVGDEVCVTLRHGQLSMPWFKVARCDAG